MKDRLHEQYFLIHDTCTAAAVKKKKKCGDEIAAASADFTNMSCKLLFIAIETM